MRPWPGGQRSHVMNYLTSPPPLARSHRILDLDPIPRGAGPLRPWRRRAATRSSAVGKRMWSIWRRHRREEYSRSHPQKKRGKLSLHARRRRLAAYERRPLGQSRDMGSRWPAIKFLWIINAHAATGTLGAARLLSLRRRERTTCWRREVARQTLKSLESRGCRLDGRPSRSKSLVLQSGRRLTWLHRVRVPQWLLSQMLVCQHSGLVRATRRGRPRGSHQ